ncbi:MAG TPA: peptide ABC transporter substrate-binding protein [Anaerolineales bacterium]
MLKNKPLFKWASMIAIATMLLTACSPAATPAPTQPAAAPTPTAAAAQPTATTAASTAATPTAAATSVATSAATSAVTAAPTMAAATGAPGGTLRWSLEGINELPAMDPPLAGASQSVGVISLVFEGLVRLDSSLNIAPAGAESWDVKDGGKTFIFHIRKGLKFANGDPVTAEDFSYSLNRAFGADFANGNAGYYLSNIVGSTDVTNGKAKTISGVKVIDPQTLEIDLTNPSVYFLYQLTFPASFVVPKSAVDASPKSWTDKAYGTGPFMVQEWKHNQSITLVPNPNYWLGKPQLAQIQMPFIQDPATALKLYQTGELDIMGTYNFPTDQIASVASSADFHQVNQFFVTYIGFNDVKSPFKDVRVRQAFAKAVDKETLINKVLEGAVVQSDTIIPPGMPGYNKDAGKIQGYDVTAAQKLLADAGFPGGKNFPKVALSINNQDPNYAKIAAALQQMWSENLGVTVDINTEELAKFNDDLTALANKPDAPAAFNFFISVWGADYPDPQNFVSQQLRTGVGNNNGHYSNPQFDKLVDQADVETDSAKRLQLYQQAEQIALTEVGWLPLYYGKADILLRSSVQGLVITPQGILPKDDWTKVTVSK